MSISNRYSIRCARFSYILVDHGGYISYGLLVTIRLVFGGFSYILVDHAPINTGSREGRLECARF